MNPPSITIEIDCDSIDVVNSKLHYLSERIAKVHAQLLDLGEGSEIEEHIAKLEVLTAVSLASDPDRYGPSAPTHTANLVVELRAELAKERQAHLSTQVGHDQTARILKSVQRSCDATQQERRALQRSYETVSNANRSLQNEIVRLQDELDQLKETRELADELGADLEKLHLTATNSTLQLDCPYCDGIGKWQHRPWKETTDAPATA